MSEELRAIVLGTMAGYVVLMFALAYVAQRRVESVEDYVVAGRRLSFWFAAPTLLATWFGAGTMMTAADEVRGRGLVAATLDPLGAGICLLLAGLLLAKPLWELRLTTLADFFRIKFGSRAERLAAVLMVPSYFGWIAAQFIALAGMLELFGGIPLQVGLVLVAVVGVGYTLLGGMWAVTLTDAVQIAVAAIGLILLGGLVLTEIGGDVPAGLATVFERTPKDRMLLVDAESATRFFAWSGVLCAGALGNLPMQDLAQRIFAARSANVARAACFAAGGAYLVLGAIPVVLGLSAAVIAGNEGRSTLAWLAGHFLHPGLAVVFVIIMMSIILSTIDSAILAPATVLAQNLLADRFHGVTSLGLNRYAVLAVGVVSLGFAYAGESAYALLESAYELGMVSLLVPLLFGLYARHPSSEGAVAAMASGFLTWLTHLVFGAERFLGLELPLPVGLASTAVAFATYVVVSKISAHVPPVLIR